MKKLEELVRDLDLAWGKETQLLTDKYNLTVAIDSGSHHRDTSGEGTLTNQPKGLVWGNRETGQLVRYVSSVDVFPSGDGWSIDQNDYANNYIELDGWDGVVSVGMLGVTITPPDGSDVEYEYINGKAVDTIEELRKGLLEGWGNYNQPFGTDDGWTWENWRSSEHVYSIEAESKELNGNFKSLVKGLGKHDILPLVDQFSGDYGEDIILNFDDNCTRPLMEVIKEALVTYLKWIKTHTPNGNEILSEEGFTPARSDGYKFWEPDYCAYSANDLDEIKLYAIGEWKRCEGIQSGDINFSEAVITDNITGKVIVRDWDSEWSEDSVYDAILDGIKGVL